MKYLVFFYCMLGIAFAVRDKQLNLEDIEKDNLANERRSQQFSRPAVHDQQLPQQYITPPQPITPPKLQYGFKPMKTQPQYTQQPQYATAHQPSYTPSQQHFNIAPQQYTTVPQYFTYQPVQQHQQQQLQQQYIAPSRAQQYVQSHPQYQQLELPFITDNHIAQDTQNLQQYYTPAPQFVYLQPYSQASNNIQTVVDPKGGIQYVMYLTPQYVQGGKAEQTQNVETLLQPQDQLYSPDFTFGNSLGGGEQQYQYIDVPQAQPQVKHQPQAQVQVQSQLHVQPQVQVEPQKFVDIQYVQQPKVEESPKYNFVPQKYEPKSLLDSYVPSILQVQYLKQQQQQAQANAIRQASKLSQPVVGKSDYTKNYAPQAAPSPSQSFQYVSFANRPAKH